MMLLQWWWREDEILGTKLDSFVLLFGSPLESCWPGVGSPGFGTVKTFLEEDATVLKVVVDVPRGRIHHVFVVEWSYVCYTRSRLLEWVAILSVISNDWSELPLEYLVNNDTSCWKWIVEGSKSMTLVVWWILPICKDSSRPFLIIFKLPAHPLGGHRKHSGGYLSQNKLFHPNSRHRRDQNRWF